MTEFHVQDISPQPAAAIRAEVPMAELTSVFDRAFGAVMAAATRQGLALTGPPFGFYPRMPGATVEVVVGFPVSGALEPDGEVMPFELPGGRAITAVHVGSYDGLEATYRDLVTWAESEGLQVGSQMWESYLTDPSAQPDPATWRTSITWPLA